MRTPTPFSVVGTRRTYVVIAHRKCYFVQLAGNTYTSEVFGRVGGVSNVFVFFHYLLWKAKLNFDCLEPKPRLVFYSLGLYPFCFFLCVFSAPFWGRALLQGGISARNICLFRADLLPLLLAKMCQLLLFLFCPLDFCSLCGFCSPCAPDTTFSALCTALVAMVFTAFTT